MTSVLKPDRAARDRVRPFAMPAPPGAAQDPGLVEMATLRAERDRLARQIDAMAAQARTAQVEAVAAARADGYRAGLAAAETREGERIAAMAGGMAIEAERWRGRLDALDGLAAALVRVALAKIFDRPDTMADMVVAALMRQVALLRDRSGLTIRVSAADFADTAGLERAMREVGASVAVSIDADLPGGACRLSAGIGGLDVDVPAQWAALSALLDEMAAS